MGKSSPRPPDPYATAAAQSSANKEAVRESASVNAVDQFAPWGSTTFTRSPDGVPTAQNIKLAPGQQQFFDLQTNIGNRLGGKAQGLAGPIPDKPFSLSDVPQGADVSNALYNRRKAIIEPDLARSRNLLNTELSDRGIPLGSEISNNERDRFGRMQNEAYSNIANESILAGTAEEDRQLQRSLLERAQPFNEVAAFLQGAPAMATPSFQSTPAYNIGAPDISGLIGNDYQNRLDRSNQRNQQFATGVSSVGKAALGLK